MNKHLIRNDFLLLLAASIWGFAFVAQRVGMVYVGPFTYNGIRFIIGPISLLPLILYRRKTLSGYNTPLRLNIIGGLIAGICLFIASSLQQIGLIYTTAGNAGFITGFYVIFVQIFGIFLGKRVGWLRWLAAATALAGLFMLSVKSDFSMGRGDMLVLACAVFYALHIMVVAHFVTRIDSIVFSFIQFLICGILSLAAAFIFEEPSITSVGEAWIPILYGGIMSVGVAYTLQVVAQKDVPAGHAVIILALEGAFAALGGGLILHEILSSRELIGCIFLFAGMLLSQVSRKKETVKVAVSRKTE